VESGNAQGFALVLHVASWAELRTVRAPSASGDHDSAVRAAGGFLAGMTHSKDRALEIHEITFDARDPHALAGFWGALLEREIRPGDMPQDDSVLVMSAPGQPGLLFLRVPEAKRAKNRVHFDLWPTSAKRDMQVERPSAWARWSWTIGAGRTGPGGWCSPTRKGTSSASDEAQLSGRRVRTKWERTR
jgi:hypothetical protein